MKSNKAALHNLKRGQQQKESHKHKGGTTRKLRIAIVLKPDGDWVAVGGNNPESERMTTALWGAPDGSLTLWADVIATVPPEYAQQNRAPARNEPENQAPIRNEPENQESRFYNGSAPIPSGVFVGPGGPLPIIDVAT